MYSQAGGAQPGSDFNAGGQGFNGGQQYQGGQQTQSNPNDDVQDADFEEVH